MSGRRTSMEAEPRTRLASWQVICPDGAYAGGNMLVNVPVAAAPPMVMAQAVDPSAQVPMGIAMPPQQQMGMVMAQPIMAQPMAQPMVMAPQGVAPVNNTMARGPMDDRMHEATSGCYYSKNAPCCWAAYMSFDKDRSKYGQGPVYCCCVCPWLCCPPGMCGVQKAVSPGSSVYKGDSGEDIWQSPTMFTRSNESYGQKNEVHVKC